MLCNIKNLASRFAFALLLSCPAGVSLAAPPLQGDGKAIDLDELGLRITVPAGWQLELFQDGKALVLKEPQSSRLPQDAKDTFQRQITADLSYETVTIDDKQMARLRQELQQMYSEQADELQIADEMKFFNYKSENDGIIAYSFVKKDGLELTNMHILLAGEMNRVLLTATELSANFENNMDQNWQILSSVEIIGPAPDFWAKWQPVIIVAAALLALLYLLALIRRWRVRRWLKLAEIGNDDQLSQRNSERDSDKPEQSLESRQIQRGSKSAYPPLPKPPVKAAKAPRPAKASARQAAQPSLPPLPQVTRAKKAGRNANSASRRLPPPPPSGHQAVAQSFDRNWEDDWQWVSGQDDIF